MDFDVAPALTSPTFTAPIWADPKVQHRGRNPHRYLRVKAPTAPASVSVVINVTIGGVVGPVDGALGGRLIVASILAWSGSAPFAVTQPAGHTTQVTLTFTADMLGHQELVLRRPGGGALILGVDVEA